MRRLIRTFLPAVLLAFMLPAAASADSTPAWARNFEKPMKIAIVRSSEAGCEPYCPEWIMAEGAIVAGTAAEFIAAYARGQERSGGKGLPVILHSPGGSMIEALHIGYFLRHHGAEVGVGRTIYKGCKLFDERCKPPGGGPYRGQIQPRDAYCASACPFILSGGATRLAGAGTLVGVHHWGYENPLAGTKTESSRKSAAQNGPVWDKVVRQMVTDYINGMGIAPAIIDDIIKTPYASLKYYNLQRRQKLKLVTSAASAQELGSAAGCEAETRPARCVLPGDTPEYRQSLERQGLSGKPGMTVTVVRDSRPGCEPRCQQWIAAKGVIRPETPQKFEKVLGSLGKAMLPVVIDSPGGDLDAAMEIGRMIHRSGLDVVVADLAHDGCVPGGKPCSKKERNRLPRGVPGGTQDGCSNVCALILAAGRQRVLASGKNIELRHPQAYLSRGMPGAGQHQIGLYLMEMGVGLGLAERIRKIAGENAREAFAAEDSRQLALVTSLDETPFIAPAAACGGKPAPGHCVKRRK